MFRVELSVHANNFIEKLDIHQKRRIEKVIKRLEKKPVPSDAKFIGREFGGWMWIETGENDDNSWNKRLNASIIGGTGHGYGQNRIHLGNVG